MNSRPLAETFERWWPLSFQAQFEALPGPLDLQDYVKSELGLPSKFVRKELLLLCGGYVRELAPASYPHIHGGGGDFLCAAGGACGGWWLA